MNCPGCDKAMRETDTYFKCVCGIVYRKCQIAPKNNSLYPNKQSKFSKQQKEAILAIMAISIVIGGFMVWIGYLAVMATVQV